MQYQTSNHFTQLIAGMHCIMDAGTMQPLLDVEEGLQQWRSNVNASMVSDHTVNDFTPITFANRGHVPNRGQLSASTSNSGSDPD